MTRCLTTLRIKGFPRGLSSFRLLYTLDINNFGNGHTMGPLIIKTLVSRSERLQLRIFSIHDNA